jgi:MFS family permease
VQVRLIGRWSRKYGERKLVFAALALLALGLLMLAITPDQPHPLYIQRQVEASIRAPTSAEAVIGEIRLTLPEDNQRGFGGIVWFLIAVVPLSIGAGLIRPALNSLLIQQVQPGQSGAILGVSAAFVSLANAVAPLIGGLIFQASGVAAPFLVGGGVMAVLLLISLRVIRPELRTQM